MIVWNEIGVVEDAIASAEGLADEIVVVDTCSKDETAEVCRNLGCHVVVGGDRMHKGQSRNDAIDAANGDWVVILDADERIQDPEGLRAYLERTKAEALWTKTECVRGGRVTLSQHQIRIWRKGIFRYKYRAHEVPMPTKEWPNVKKTDFVWQHVKDIERQTERPTGWKLKYTLDRLLLDVEENPSDARPKYYLGRQYRYLNDWRNAIKWLKAYLDHGKGRDRADAYADLALCYKNLGDLQQAIHAYYAACAEMPDRRDWWGKLAEIYHDLGRNRLALAHVELAMSQPKPQGTYTYATWYGAHIYDLAARCCWGLKDYEKGYKYASKALSLAPNDKRLRDNIGFFEQQLGFDGGRLIMITGCAKSGTTLVRRLMYAFKDVVIIPREIGLDTLVSLREPNRTVIAKRTQLTLFSEKLSYSEELEDHQANLIADEGIEIVNVIRDGHDVVLSNNRYVSPTRWIASMEQRERHKDLIGIEIHYEDIVERADDVQQEVAHALNLEIVHPWSEYPSFVPDIEFPGHGDGYERRPLDDSSIGKSETHPVDELKERFDEQLALAGYGGD
jgi:glycosyltransferase involved in cell wall biosynthesis